MARNGGTRVAKKMPDWIPAMSQDRKTRFKSLEVFDFSVENIHEIVDLIPTIKGISMMIADGSGRNNDHFLSYDSVVAILKKLNQVSLY